jgi:hypothetical protein
MAKRSIGLTLGELEHMRPCAINDRRALFGDRQRRLGTRLGKKRGPK